MFFESVVKIFNNTYSALNDNNIDKVDPNIVKYFRTEYGKDWKVALEHHLYKKNINSDKKAS